MPMFDPFAAVFGCGVMLVLLSAYVIAPVAIALAIRSGSGTRPGLARFARWSGTACFFAGFLFVIFFSHVTEYKSPYGWILFSAIPAVLGAIGWSLGIRAALERHQKGFRRQAILVGVAFIACSVVAVLKVQHDTRYRQRRDALLAAAARGDAVEVRRLLAAGLSPEVKTFNGERLLSIVPNAATAREVLSAGANANADPKALRAAAARGDLELTRLLLEHGADPNSPGEGHSAATQAWWNHHEDVLELLEQFGAKDAEALQHATGALLEAARQGDAAQVKMLLKQEHLDEERLAALELAARSGDAGVLWAIAEVTPDYTEIAEVTLIAAENGHTEMFAGLVDNMDARQGAFVARETKAAALGIAAKNGNADIARVAIAKGAALNARDAEGRTPLMKAAKRGNVEIVSLLIDAGAEVKLSDWPAAEFPINPAVFRILQAAEKKRS